MRREFESSDPWEEALRRRARGDLTGAVICLFAHQLLTLSRLGLVRLAPGRTGRQLLRAVADAEFRGLALPTLRQFEVVYYGHRTPSPEEFAEVWQKPRAFRPASRRRGGGRVECRGHLSADLAVRPLPRPGRLWLPGGRDHLWPIERQEHQWDGRARRVAPPARCEEVRTAVRATKTLSEWANVVVRFAGQPGPPDVKEGKWLNEWLMESSGSSRVVLHHPRDYDSELEFWETMLAAELSLQPRRVERVRSVTWRNPGSRNSRPGARTRRIRFEWFAVDPSFEEILDLQDAGGSVGRGCRAFTSFPHRSRSMKV